MTRSLRARARRERAARELNFALTETLRSLTFPIRNPRLWLRFRFYAVFYALYSAGHVDLAFRFARIWPQAAREVTNALIATGQPVLVVFL